MDYRNILETYTGTTILIIGGSGFIGSNVVRALLPANPTRIIVLDDYSSSFPWVLPSSPVLDVIDGSILDENKLNQAFDSSPDFVFHIAAHFANQKSVDYPEDDLMGNGLGLLRVLEHSRRLDIGRFIFTGSSCVYGSHGKFPLREEDTSLRLETPYQIHKLLGELYCNQYNETYGLKTCICRLFNVYGPGEVPGEYRNVIPNFFWAAMNNLSLKITGTGEETRDFGYVEDIVDGILRLGVFKTAVGETINIASGKETSIIDLATQINEITGNKAGVDIGPKRIWDKSSRRLGSIEKARKLIGYEPKILLRDGLENLYKWFSTNWETIMESVPQT